MRGVVVLAASHPVPSTALTFVAAHVLECLLKAILSKRGMSEKDLKDKVRRHNLARLWQDAAAGGPPFTTAIPAWVDRLNGLHDRPFFLRYPTTVHGLVLPATPSMVEELAALLPQVREEVLR